MIDSSFMTTIPDSWALNKKFLLMAVNNWNTEYERVLLGGLTTVIRMITTILKPIQMPSIFQISRRKGTIYWLLSYRCIPRIRWWVRRNQPLSSPDPKWLIIDRDEHGSSSKECSVKNRQLTQCFVS